VWNEVVASKQKPTKTLGRTALADVWDDLHVRETMYQQLSSLYPAEQFDEEWKVKIETFVDTFERLLFSMEQQHDDLPDARLIWDADGGEAELARRAAERLDRASTIVRRDEEKEEVNSSSSISPRIIIEELTEKDVDVNNE
jgi:hypothetical protein